MSDIASGGSLVERILQGDRSAEEELIQRYWRGIFVIVRARIRHRDPEEARDLTQNTFIAVLQAVRAGKVREPEKLVGFIHGVAKNLINNFLHHEVETCELDQEIPGRDPVESLEAADRRRKARDAICSLSKLDQQILLGVLVEGASLEEIAMMLGISSENVRTRKLRAIKKLKKRFERVSHT